MVYVKIFKEDESYRLAVNYNGSRDYCLRILSAISIVSKV